MIKISRENLQEQGKWQRPARDFGEIPLTEHLEQQLIRLGQYESLCILAANKAHDFNNLLTIISGNITLIKMNSNGEPRISKWLEEAQEATAQASKLARQLLEIAKGECSAKKVCSIKEILQQSSSIALSTGDVNGIFNLHENLWKAYVDEGQIKQVIINLVMNAGQAMPDGGTLWIEADNIVIAQDNKELYQPGKYVKISIRDEGEGIPEEYHNNLFEPFFTTKEKGTGLGLSSSYSIIRNHGGYMNFISGINQGTTFNIFLPAVTGQENNQRREA